MILAQPPREKSGIRRYLPPHMADFLKERKDPDHLIALRFF